MITFHPQSGTPFEIREQAGSPLPFAPLWIDVFDPTESEEKWLEEQFCLDVPTRAEAEKKEVMGQFYEENGNIYLTATLVSRTDEQHPETDAVIFILTNSCLITVRHSAPKAFLLYAQKLERVTPCPDKPSLVLEGLIDTINGRLADVMQSIGSSLDEISNKIFSDIAKAVSDKEFYVWLRQVGRTGDLVMKIRESLNSLTRTLNAYGAFVRAHEDQATQNRVSAIQRDIRALTDTAGSLSQEITFLANTIMGLLTMQQNAIIKIFSVAAVMLLPPTLVASIYGMNFEFMPELHWHYGYPLALALMALSAIASYVYFRLKRWL